MEHNLSEIGHRLKLVREHLKKGQPEFCKILGSTVSGYQQNEYGKTMPGGKTLSALASLGVNTNWVLIGEGEMLLKHTHEIKEVNSVGYSVNNKGFNNEEFDLVPVYDVEASAGHGSVVDGERQISQIAFRKDWLQEKSLTKNHLATLKARGDSMEPTITDRDTLLIDTHINKVIDDSIYIIRSDGHLAVKRLQQNFDGSVTIISDNPRYQQQSIPAELAEKLTIAGRVVWVGHEI